MTWAEFDSLQLQLQGIAGLDVDSHVLLICTVLFEIQQDGCCLLCVWLQEQHVRVRELQAEFDKMEDRVRAESAQKADLQVRTSLAAQQRFSNRGSCAICTKVLSGMSGTRFG